MHVCILTTVHTAFDTRIFQRQALSLVRSGYRVSLIAPHGLRETVDGVEIIPIPRYASRTKRMGLALRVLRMALGQKADVYHFHDPELMFVCVLLRLLRRVPVIFDVHEHYPNAIISKEWIPRPLRRLVAFTYRACEAVAVPILGSVVYTTPLVGERYRHMRCTSVRVDNFPTVRFVGTGSTEIPITPDRHKRMVYVGGLQPGRGISEALQAFDLVRREVSGAMFTLIGKFESDSYRNSVISLIEDLHLESVVEIRAHLPYDQLAGDIQANGIGVVTYLPLPNNVSCLPNKLFEYMAAGLAVIASDFPQYTEVVQGSRCGQNVDPTRPVGIARAIVQLMSNPELTLQMGLAGREAYLSTYNWEAEEVKLLDFYRRFGAGGQSR